MGTVLQRYVRFLSYVGAVYILWLAFHILLSKQNKDENDKSDCNFWTGLLLQVTNVKVIIFCITALSSYALPYTNSFFTLLLIGLFLPLTGPTCNLAWLYTGVSLQKVFEKYQRPINIIMAVSLVICAISLIL